jgi:hypothetical protein
MFIGLGKLVDHTYSSNACRTQLNLQFNDECAKYFIDNPLGNHHLVIPGNFTETLYLSAGLLGIQRIPKV